MYLDVQKTDTLESQSLLKKIFLSNCHSDVTPLELSIGTLYNDWKETQTLELCHLKPNTVGFVHKLERLSNLNDFNVL